jgi:hypothetical protein
MVPTSMFPRWRAAGRSIGEDETDQDCLPMTHPANVRFAPARFISQAEHNTNDYSIGFIFAKHSTDR